MYKQYTDNLYNRISNLQHIIMNIEEAQDNEEVFKMYKQGSQTLANLLKLTPIHDIEQQNR
eukprot:UN02624